MKTIKDLINTEKGRSALVIGAGSSIKKYKDKIWDFIKREGSFVIGINNMTNFFIPNYHLWTNTERFRSFGQNINKRSNILLGSNISLKVIKEIIGDREYVVLNRKDREGVSIGYRNGVIYGYFRTAGCLAIMLSHLMGASEINIVGMDGYTMYHHEDLKIGKKSQHCYGEGFTDTASWETCVMKDGLVENALNNVKEYGIDFKILTPTKYGGFYDSTRLHT